MYIDQIEQEERYGGQDSLLRQALCWGEASFPCMKLAFMQL